MVRRGSWSRVVWRSVDFIPMKFYGVPSCLALGVGALSAGARARFSAAPPRGPPGSGGTFSGGPPVCRHRTAFQWRGPSVAEGVHAALHPPLRPVGLAAYRVPPIAGRPPPVPSGHGRDRTRRWQRPGARHVKPTLCMRRPRLSTNGTLFGFAECRAALCLFISSLPSNP